MYERILVAVDGSKPSERALGEALRLARSGAALKLVHVVDLAPLAFEMELSNLAAIEEAMREAGHHHLRKALECVHAGKLRADVALLEVRKPMERIADLIVQDARTYGADLIVLGTHGRRGLGHLVMGSVAEGVVRVAPVPVLLVRADEKR